MSFAAHESALRAGRFLHVINYHVTPASQQRRLERELASYLTHFDPVLPEHLDTYFTTGRWPLPRQGFVAAFYDGHREHATVAAPVCERLGIRGWFLPVTGFLDCPVEQQRDYTDLHNLWTPDQPDADGRLALTWDELARIGSRHVIAAHTAGHVPPTAVTTPPDVDRELQAPRARLAACAGTAPVAMAWGGGLPFDGEHVAFRAMQEAGYRYLVSATKVQRIAS